MSAAKSIEARFKVFMECDCTMVEVNPFVELTDGHVIVCDAKVGFNDKAEFRQSRFTSSATRRRRMLRRSRHQGTNACCRWWVVDMPAERCK